MEPSATSPPPGASSPPPGASRQPAGSQGQTGPTTTSGGGGAGAQALGAPMASDIRYRRQIYLIDREFQYRFATTWLLLTVGFVVITVLIHYFAAKQLQDPDQQKAMQLLLRSLPKYNLWFIIALLGTFSVYLVYMAHRIAGPAYRLTNSVLRMVAGDYNQEVRVRKKDYLVQLADALNMLTENLRIRQARLEQLRKQADALDELLKDTQGSPADAQQTAGRIASDLASLVARPRP